MGALAELAEKNGLVLLLIAVVAQDTRVQIHTELRDDDASRRRLAEHATAMQRWEGRFRTSGHLPAPPAQPADDFQDLRITLTDNIGTTYQWRGSAIGGTGSERIAMSDFSRDIPRTATEVSVWVDGVVRFCGRPLNGPGLPASR